MYRFTSTFYVLFQDFQNISNFKKISPAIFKALRKKATPLSGQRLKSGVFFSFSV